MEQELQALESKLGHDALALHFVKMAFTNLTSKMIKQIVQVTNFNIKRYSQLPDVYMVCQESEDLELRIQTVLQTIPTFPFLVANQLNTQPGFFQNAKNLQVAGITAVVMGKEAIQSRVSRFLQDLDPNAELESLNQKLGGNTKEVSYLPKVLNWDFLLIAKNYIRFKPTKNTHELVEYLYSFLGISQVFFRYYFDLIREAPNDTVATHIDGLFSKPLTYLHSQEYLYWKNFRNPETVKGKLFDIIKKDTAGNRHPRLRKETFVALHSHNPITSTESSQNMGSSGQALLEEQLEEFLIFSYEKWFLFLNTLLQARKQYCILPLLHQINHSAPEKLGLFHEFLEEKVTVENDALFKIVSAFVGQLNSSTDSGFEFASDDFDPSPTEGPSEFQEERSPSQPNSGQVLPSQKTPTKEPTTEGQVSVAKKPSQALQQGMSYGGSISKVNYSQQRTSSSRQSIDGHKNSQEGAEAKKNLTNFHAKSEYKSLSQEKVAQYLKKWLDQLYDYVRKEGALTQDRISEYLEKFAKSTELLLSEETIDEEMVQNFEETTDSLLVDIRKEGNLSPESVNTYWKQIQKETDGLVDANQKDRAKKVSQIGKTITEAALESGKKQEEKENEKEYQKILQIELKIEDRDSPCVTTIKKLLGLSILRKEKMHFLHSYVPDPLPVKSIKLIEQKLFIGGEVIKEPVGIYDRNGNLLKKKLIKLLNVEEELENLLRAEIIPTGFKPNDPRVSVHDFFTFPFGDRGGPLEEDWFQQHVHYLKLVLGKGKLESETYDKIESCIPKFEKYKYKRYFDIFPHDEFEETTFMAVLDLWKNRAFEKLRIMA